MKLLLSSLMLLCFAAFVNGQNIEKQAAEKIVRTYFSGYEKQDWNITASQLADGFTKIRCITEDHITPFNTKQNFLFCSFKATA